MEVKKTMHKDTKGTDFKMSTDVYDIGNYSVSRIETVFTNGDEIEYFDISFNKEKRFLPAIIFNGVLNNDEKKFIIQTISYGALSTEEINQVIEGYKEAVEIVNILTEKFLKKDDEEMENITIDRADVRISSIISKEFKQWKNSILNNTSPREIFDMAYEIHAKTSIEDFFSCIYDKYGYSLRLLKLYNSTPNINLLQALYDYYLKYEWTSINSTNDIQCMINGFCDEYCR